MERVYEFEPQLARTLQEESWYPDYIAVCEIMASGLDQDKPGKRFFEEVLNGNRLAFEECKQFFKSNPGPTGWLPPSDERILNWIKSAWLDPKAISLVRSILVNESDRA